MHLTENKMTDVLVPLAQGCEELEAITIIDILVRAGIKVTTAGLDESPVVASRGTTIIPDTQIQNVQNIQFDMVVLPGGLPGSDHLRDNEIVQDILKKHANADKYVAAICAAPKALAQAGILENKVATSYPGVLDSLALKNTQIKNTAIEVDGKTITSRSVGTAMDFSLKLIELLEGVEKRNEIEKSLAR